MMSVGILKSPEAIWHVLACVDRSDLGVLGRIFSIRIAIDSSCGGFKVIIL